MLRLQIIHGSSITTFPSANPMGMKSFPVGIDNTCLHFSLFCLTQFEQESTNQLTVCLTVPATTEEAAPCLTSYGIVHESCKEMTDRRHTNYQATKPSLTLWSLLLHFPSRKLPTITQFDTREVHLKHFPCTVCNLPNRHTVNCTWIRLLQLLLTCPAMLV